MQWHPTPVLDEGAWWAIVHGVSESWTRLSDFHFHFSLSCIGEANGNPLQCSCPENPRDGVAQSRTQLSDLATAAADLGMTGAKITTLQSVEVDQLNF